jgi:Phycobilisome protein
MLSQMQRLCMEADGRYATDDELRFLPDYLRTYELRLQTYLQLQKLEAAIFQQAYTTALAKDPQAFRSGEQDLTSVCKRDTLHTLHYCATAMLLDDPQIFQERYLLWFQSIIRAVSQQSNASLIYTAMQTAVKQLMPPQQANLLIPLLAQAQQMMAEGL